MSEDDASFLQRKRDVVNVIGTAKPRVQSGGDIDSTTPQAVGDRRWNMLIKMKLDRSRHPCLAVQVFHGAETGTAA